nr:MAG TPA: hypothetical protein [Caudoviricetes sp.]
MLQLKFDNLIQAKGRVLNDKVCDLPLSTQALYLHAIFNGTFDKEGNITNIKALARAIGASAGDIQLLTDEEFYREIKGEDR